MSVRSLFDSGQPSTGEDFMGDKSPKAKNKNKKQGEAEKSQQKQAANNKANAATAAKKSK